MQCNSNVELGFAFATDSFNSASNIIANCSVQITKCGYIGKTHKAACVSSSRDPETDGSSRRTLDGKRRRLLSHLVPSSAWSGFWNRRKLLIMRRNQLNN